MNMILIALTLMLHLKSYADSDILLWPIEGKIVGENILYQPEDLIGDEVNKSALFIGGELNCDIIAPSGGTITSIMLITQKSLNIVSGTSRFDNEYRRGAPKGKTFNIRITSNDGINYNLSGLNSIGKFKTGEKIKQGDKLGKLGYAYSNITKPNLCFSISKNGKVSDPMTPFGLKSQFIPYTPVKNDYSYHKYSVEKLLEDYMIFRLSLEKGHPGLYDFMSKNRMDSLFNKIESELNLPMTSQEFLNTIRPVIIEIRDSHTSINLSIAKTDQPTSSENRPGYLPVSFCLQNDSLIIYNTTEDYTYLLEKSITAIDGIPKDSIIKGTRSTYIGPSVGYIESKADGDMHYLFSMFYKSSFGKKFGDSITLTFSDNRNLTFEYGNYEKKVIRINEFLQKPKENNKFNTSIIDSNIALLDLNTFGLLETDLLAVKKFVCSLSNFSVQNLVIDVRRNSGGSSQVMNEIYPCIADKPFQSQVAEKVSTKGKIEFFKHTLNYVGVEDEYFKNYYAIDGKTGYYLSEKGLPVYEPDKNRYTGNVFVLTDEFSFSAASVFAGLIHKYKRGLVIGRETGSLYHRLNATKFARLFLPNTKIVVRIPLIQTIYDYPEKSAIPWGRGVLPDYEIPHTYQERIQDNDVFLNKALLIIQNIPTEIKPKFETYKWLIVVVSSLIVVYLVKKRRINKNAL